MYVDKNNTNIALNSLKFAYKVQIYIKKHCFFYKSIVKWSLQNLIKRIIL